MIEINLIPDVKREYLRVKLVRNTVIWLSVVLGVGLVAVACVLGMIYGGQRLAEGLQDSDIEKEGSRLTSIEDLNKTVTIQRQLALIDARHADKQINSRLIDVISAINPPAPNNMSISVLRLDPNEKTITIEGSAVNGYLALEVFKKTIANTSVQISLDKRDERLPLSSDMTTGTTSYGMSADGRRVLRFSFSFTYPVELFKWSGLPVSVITPQGRKDVTDSRLGVPQSLFGRPAKDIEE